MLKVDLDTLRALSTSLSGTADALGSLDPATPIGSAAIAMPNSAVGAVLAASRAPVLAAYRKLSVRVRDMSAAAAASADSYEQTDEAFRTQLLELQGGI